MRAWLEVLAVLLAFSLVCRMLAAVPESLPEWRRGRRVLARLLGRRRADVVVPVRRPIAAIAADVHRMHAGFHHEGMRFAQYEGRRLAYDRVLAEACDALDLSHLMAVLPAGLELDRERERVEDQLVDAGLMQRPAA